jgi:CheY-like chemotaxis protein
MATEIERKQTLQDNFEGHILLVEDNVTNQMLMSAILKKLQLTFDIAQDGLEAIDRVQEKHYDLILMDENMPKLNGIKSTKQIRMLEKSNLIRPQVIVALTANAMKGDKERFLMAGMDNYLPKPINIDDLKSVLMEYLPANRSEV